MEAADLCASSSVVSVSPVEKDLSTARASERTTPDIVSEGAEPGTLGDILSAEPRFSSQAMKVLKTLDTVHCFRFCLRCWTLVGASHCIVLGPTSNFQMGGKACEVGIRPVMRRFEARRRLSRGPACEFIRRHVSLAAFWCCAMACMSTASEMHRPMLDTGAARRDDGRRPCAGVLGGIGASWAAEKLFEERRHAFDTQ